MTKPSGRRSAILGCAVLMSAACIGPAARTQDIPGIENCSAEKTMERRTGCLQSNVNYLKAQLTQMQTVTFGRIDATNRQIEALKTTIVALQATVTELTATIARLRPADATKNEPAKNEPAKK